MKFVPVKEMRVVLNLEGSKRELGTLAWSSDERQAYFQYASDFIAAPLPMSPFRLPVRPGWAAPGDVPREFEQIHGLFNDRVTDRNGFEHVRPLCSFPIFMPKAKRISFWWLPAFSARSRTQGAS